MALIVLEEVSSDGVADPWPALAAATAGEQAVVFAPDRLGDFLEVHDECSLICEQSGLVYGMIRRHLRRRRDGNGLSRLSRWARSGRLLDVILMDQLLDLAEHGVEKDPSKLDEVVLSRCGQRVPRTPKVTPTGGQRDSDLRQARAIAANLAVALLKAYRAIRPAVDLIVGQHRVDDLPDDVGALSIGIQVKGEVALSQVSRRGLIVHDVDDLIERCRRGYRESSLILKDDPRSRGCFHFDLGLVRLTSRGLPDERDDRLVRWLEGCVSEIRGNHAFAFRPPWSRPGTTAKASSLWGELASYHDGLRAWERLWTAAATTKVLERIRGEREPRLRPAYRCLPRARSTSPNLDSLRRMGPGPIFRAPALKQMLVGRLCDLDLRFLADTHPVHWDGDGVVGGLYLRGKDPIRFAAATLLLLERGTGRIAL